MSSKPKLLLENQRQTQLSLIDIMECTISSTDGRECARGDRMRSFDRFKMDDGGVVDGGVVEGG